MSFKLREIFFILGILWATTLTPGNAEGNECDATSPDVVLRYDMSEFSVDTIECPANSSKSLYKKDNITLGVICDPGTEFDYKIRVPISNCSSLYCPKRLSITVSKDEDAIVFFQKRQKDEDGIGPRPKRDSSKSQETTDKKTRQIKFRRKGKKVVLPHEFLNGSGFVSFDADDMPYVSNISLYGGTVQITIRECPRDRYGENCTGWCKDCMYGGICNDRSGECVCPPGRKGKQCEEGCEREWTLENVQYCLPSLYGCSCGPGYTRRKCEKECDEGLWGVDCYQTCGHCKSNKCNSQNGTCEEGDDIQPCAGGLLGLPRLQKKPRVTTNSNIAEVSFEGEEPDGALSHGAKMMGYQVVVWKTDQEMKDGQTYNISDSERSIQLSSLEFCTDYQLAVLVMVRLNSSEECIANGALRGERIHKTPFIIFPEELPVPSNITISDKTQSEFTVSWKESDFPSCNISYQCQVKDEVSEEDKSLQKLNETSFSVTDLESYTNYSVVIESVLTNTDLVRKSPPANVTVITLLECRLELPRLRKKSNVTISSDLTEVSFEGEESNETLPNGAKMMGYQVVVWETDQKMKDGQTYNVSASESSANLASLEFCTDYQLAVLALVLLESPEECHVHGAQTGENIHKTPFTNCTEEITELKKSPVVPEVPEGELPKIILPKVLNPPTSQYVVVMESKDNIAKDVWKKRSVEIVKEYIANNTSKETSIDPSDEEKIEGWVAGKVNVTGNSTEIFEIGNGADDNKPLDNKKYSVVVVTEMKSGNGSEFISSGPVNINGKAVASGLSGIMFGALIFLILIALFAWSYKKRWNKGVVRIPQEEPENWNDLL